MRLLVLPEPSREMVRAGERVLYGERVDGVVRFLAGKLVVLVGSLGASEDSTRHSGTTIRVDGCSKGARNSATRRRQRALLSCRPLVG
jgi:hypothetical protein